VLVVFLVGFRSVLIPAIRKVGTVITQRMENGLFRGDLHQLKIGR
jgi:hypothetical protein